MRNGLDNWAGGILIGGVRVSNLRFADDTTSFVKTEKEMATLLQRKKRRVPEIIRFGLNINKEKIKLMIVDRDKLIYRKKKLNDLDDLTALYI